MTILRPALADSLRALKLSGMLETLDARLAQAQGGDLGYLEFLQILCDDEITRREQVAMGRRLRRARFDTETTLEGFDFSANTKRFPAGCQHAHLRAAGQDHFDKARAGFNQVLAVIQDQQ